MDYAGNSSSSAMDEGQLDIKQYLNVLRRYKWGILGLCLSVTLAVVFLVFSMRPIYSASTTLLIEQKQSKVVASIDDWSSGDMTSKEYLQTQFEVLKSRDLAERVVRELRIAEQPEYAVAGEPGEGTALFDWRSFLPQGHQKSIAPSEEDKFNLLVSRFIKHLSIEPVRNTQLVRISFESADPRLAANVANAMARAYIASQMEVRLAMTEQAASWLASRLGVLKNNLELSAKNLQDYREKNNLIDTGVSGGIFAITSSQIQELNQRLVAAQFNESQVSRRYGAKHPAAQQARIDVSEAEKALHSAKDAAMEVAKRQFRLQELEREVDANRALYDAFFTRIKEANESLQLETSNARVIDLAKTPSVPVKPQKGLIIGLAAVLSLFLAAGIAFLLDYLDTTFKDPEEVERKLGVSMLGMVPFVVTRKPKRRKPGDSKQPIMFLDAKMSGYAEAIRTIRTSVVLSGIDKSHKTILLTSSVPSEGKTTTSINLAVALGQMEKVLLIDADMRRPSIGKTLDIPANSPGLANMVTGTAELDDCILHMEDANIDILTAGLVPPNPLELLSSHRFAELLRSLCERYDRIIIDSAPALLVSDSLVISRIVDAVLYVVRSDATSHGTARSGIARMKAANAPLIGVVLNKVNMRRAAQYYGAYTGYYNYGYSYGYGSRKAPDASEGD
ncbi:GumC family protein [Fluviicoccus keumensis]|uniref:GumC family protein n=1 Tax=Fluviicoccus keumensis TaxID=1435465 RepID=UPI00102B0EB9|nr:polysaccharide biosynthesis tyrosine autokinase [Fluviicoccus keumensis]